MPKTQAGLTPAEKLTPQAPADPEVRRLRARVALLEQQIQTLLARQGIKWVVRSHEAR